MIQIITSVNEDWFSLRRQKFFGIMKSYANRGNFVFYCQLLNIFSAVYFIIIYNWPSLTPTIIYSNWNNSDAIVFKRMFPLRTKCLFENISPTAYIFIYIVQILQLFSLAFGNAGIDIFFFSLAMHICGQLEILNQEVAEIGDGDLKITKLKIIALGKRYQHLLEDAKNLEKTFSAIILVQLLINVTGISSFGMNFNIYFNFNSDTIPLGTLYTNSVFIYLYVSFFDPFLTFIFFVLHTILSFSFLLYLFTYSNFE